MAQIQVKTGKVVVVRTEVVKVATLDVERRIKQFDRTLIGRVWNPHFQNMESLLYNMPKFWRLEGKVNGADLGEGKFHFSFQSEEDIQEVLTNAPYHYDSWMVSVVRWEPVVVEEYPTDITFWAKVRGIPMQYWAEGSLRAVGKALGKELDIDVDGGYIRVTFNGFQPLVFSTVIPFDDGVEVTAKITYEKLANHCKYCFKLTHVTSTYPELTAETGLGRSNAEETTPGFVGKTEKDDDGGWEVVRKRSVKRALHMTDFDSNEFEEKHKDVTKPGGSQGFTRDGRTNRRDGPRNGARDGHSRGYKAEDQV